MTVSARRKQLRMEVFNKYNGRCAYCGEKLHFSAMQIDHFRPRFNGKVNDVEVEHIDNYMPSCRFCNQYKQSYDIETFRALLEKLHKRVKKVFVVRVAMNFGIVTFKRFSGRFYFEKINELKKGGYTVEDYGVEGKDRGYGTKLVVPKEEIEMKSSIMYKFIKRKKDKED